MKRYVKQLGKVQELPLVSEHFWIRWYIISALMIKYLRLRLYEGKRLI